VKSLKEFLQSIQDDMLIPDGIDHAFLGIAETDEGFVAVYSVEGIIANLMQEDLMDFETAEAYVDAHICSPCKGKKLAPIFVDIVPDELWNWD
jgi:hypothetical protein